jgi:hypothetical protein
MYCHRGAERFFTPLILPPLCHCLKITQFRQNLLSPSGCYLPFGSYYWNLVHSAHRKAGFQPLVRPAVCPWAENLSLGDYDT